MPFSHSYAWCNSKTHLNTRILESGRERQTYDFVPLSSFRANDVHTHTVIIRFASRTLIQPQINLFKFFQINRALRPLWWLFLQAYNSFHRHRHHQHHHRRGRFTTKSKYANWKKRMAASSSANTFVVRQQPLNMALTIRHRNMWLVHAVPWMNIQWTRNRSFVVNLVCTVY